MSKVVGLRLVAIAVIVSVVGWISYSVIQSIREQEQDKVKVEQLQRSIEIRERVNEAVRNNRNNTAVDSLDSLRQRQSGE